MVVIEDAELRMERVCAPLCYHPGATVTKVVGTTNFPPSFAAAGYAAGFRGFGPPPGARSPAGSRDADDARPAFVERASILPDPPRGAFQHVAVFKNILVAADGDASARLHVFDVRDWSEKQVIRVGELDPPGPVDGAASPPSLVPAAVSALAFDGTTIAVGTHEGLLHTWRLAEREGKRGYARRSSPWWTPAPSSARTSPRTGACSPRTAPTSARSCAGSSTRGSSAARSAWTASRRARRSSSPRTRGR